MNTPTRRRAIEILALLTHLSRRHVAGFISLVLMLWMVWSVAHGHGLDRGKHRAKFGPLSVTTTTYSRP